VKTNTACCEIYDFAALENELSAAHDLLVVNFWATWCKPCIEELPEFDELAHHYESENLRIMLVSLDFKEDLESKLKPFLQENPQQHEVVLLDAGKPKYWLDKIDPSWSGALPATAMYDKTGKKLFFKEGSITFSALKDVIDRQL